MTFLLFYKQFFSISAPNTIGNVLFIEIFETMKLYILFQRKLAIGWRYFSCRYILQIFVQPFHQRWRGTSCPFFCIFLSAARKEARLDIFLRPLQQAGPSFSKAVSLLTNTKKWYSELLEQKCSVEEYDGLDKTIRA